MKRDIEKRLAKAQLDGFNERFKDNPALKQNKVNTCKKYIFALIVGIIIMILFLIGCGGNKNSNYLYVLTPDFIKKDNFYSFENKMEATPFIWDNKVYMMINDRESNVTTNYIEIYDENDTLLSRTETTMSFSSAIVDTGTLYVTGRVDTKLYQMKTTDLINWTNPSIVFNGITGAELFNSSIDKLADGSFVMSYETCEPNTKCFNIRFLKSTDLENWTQVGIFFSPQVYAACPTIRVIDGVYYMFYLRSVGHYPTYIARSTDLINWETSPKAVLSALETEGEINNNSDMDIVEKDGKVIINYAVGDQVTHTHIKRARYNGTMKQFVAEFF